MSRLLAVLLVMAVSMSTLAQTESGRRSSGQLPAGYWPLEKSQPIIDKTQTIRLAPDLSHLTAGEREALQKLLEVGKIFQRLYEKQRHPQAGTSFAALAQLDKRLGSPRSTQNLMTLYRLNQGPIATTLDNKREEFLPVEPVQPGKNVYPWGVKKEEIDAFLTANPDKRVDILALRAVVRRATAKNLADDVARLTNNPLLDSLHPGLKDELQVLQGVRRGTKPRPSSQQTFYAVPYSVNYSYADELGKASQLLYEAAEAVEKDDEEFARYLRNRARDLLSDDYESGDASWITGRFKNLNAEIGSYETYDDELFGVKTFFAVSILATRQQETTALGKR